MDSTALKHIQQKINEEIAKTKVTILNYKELTKPIAPSPDSYRDGTKNLKNGRH